MSIGPRLMLNTEQHALLNALCDNRADSGSTCMGGGDLKQALGWDDQRLFAVVDALGGPAHYPPRQLLTYRSHRTSGSVQQFIDQVRLGPDGIRYCDSGRPTSI